MLARIYRMIFSVLQFEPSQLTSVQHAAPAPVDVTGAVNDWVITRVARETLRSVDEPPQNVADWSSSIESSQQAINGHQVRSVWPWLNPRGR